MAKIGNRLMYGMPRVSGPCARMSSVRMSRSRATKVTPRQYYAGKVHDGSEGRRAARWHRHLCCPERSQGIHGGLDVVRAVHTNQGDEHTGNGRTCGSGGIQSCRVERQGIQQVPGAYHVANESLARWLLKGLGNAGQKSLT